MARLFNRKVRLTILPSVGQGVLIEELRMSFTCEKSVEKQPNTLKLSIYNMNRDHRALIESEKIRVSLEAGYEKTIAVIFIGNVERVVHKKQRGDIITQLECKDGGNRYRNARINKSYGPGVRADFVINDLATELGLQISEFVDLPATQYANGLTLSGLIRDELTNVTSRSGHEWSVQDETLQVIPKDRTTNEGVILLNFESGLVNRPTKTKKGVNFTSLLQPDLKPGNAVNIDVEAEELRGKFKIKKVVHQGDSNQGNYRSVCEAIR